MSTHELKSWPEFFEPILNGSKAFELRINDRDYAEGDLLWLREWDDIAQEYTGRECYQRVTYILEGFGQQGVISPLKGLLRGYVIMSIMPADGV